MSDQRLSMKRPLSSVTLGEHSLSFNPFLLAGFGAISLTVFAIINGYAILFIDSRSYIRGAGLAVRFLTHVDLVATWKSVTPTVSSTLPNQASKTSDFTNNGITSNRSIYYGLLLLFGYVSSSFWLTVLTQAYIAAATIAVAFRVRTVILNRWIYLIATFVLGTLTTLGCYVDYMMPDLFSGLLIISAGLLFAYYERLNRSEIGFCLVVIALALLFHQSNNAILLALIIFEAVYLAIRGSLFARRNVLFALTGCLVVSAMGQLAFSYGLRRATGSPPLLLPHLTAHLVEMGPGYRYIRASCPESGFAVCRFEDRLPIYWEDFVGLSDPHRGVFAPADLATKTKLSAEQVNFAVQTFLFDPRGVTIGMLRDGLRQIARFSPLGLRYNSGELQYFREHLPTDVNGKIRRSMLGRTDGILVLVNLTNLGMVFAGSAILCIFYIRRSQVKQSQTDAGLACFVTIVLAGVLLNAGVCGMLASPLDRYQARVIWLIPFAAIMVLITRPRKETAGD